MTGPGIISFYDLARPVNAASAPASVSCYRHVPCCTPTCQTQAGEAVGALADSWAWSALSTLTPSRTGCRRVAQVIEAWATAHRYQWRIQRNHAAQPTYVFRLVAQHVAPAAATSAETRCQADTCTIPAGGARAGTELSRAPGSGPAPVLGVPVHVSAAPRWDLTLGKISYDDISSEVRPLRG
jgi:hypothetical protein